MTNVAFDEEESVALFETGLVRFARLALNVLLAVRLEHLLHRLVDEFALEDQATGRVLVSCRSQLGEDVKQQVIGLSVQCPRKWC